MPNENPTPRSFFAEIETVILTLHFYGAAGIAAFGWAMGCFMGVSTVGWLPLWFCAALLIYNADRLRRDPADALNVPERTADSARLRTASGVTLGLAVLVLIGLPVGRQDWLTLALVIVGAIISLGYSIPVLGFRWKDVPLVKSLFAPTVITLAIFGLSISGEISTTRGVPTFPQGSLLRLLRFLVPWAWCYLLFNMLLCDLRDRAGDRVVGVRSIPVVLGEKRARLLLWLLAIVGQLLLPPLISTLVAAAFPFALLSLLTGLYQAWLLSATRRPRSERFYEWAVEGLLYFPAIAVLLARVIHRFVSDEV